MDKNSPIIIFDTTLRDGEQSPGASLNIEDKLKIADQLTKLGVNVIEAGFPIASKGDFEAVKQVAQSIKGSTIAGLARATKQDIERAWEALKYADKPRIHTFIATSDIHLEYKLKRTREQVVAMTKEAVEFAKSLCPDIEFSAEDAFRSDRDYLCQVVETAINAGATTINIPDTVGYAIPEEFGKFIKYIIDHVPNIEQAVLSCHCHNDLGLAVANSLAAVMNGVRQVECTINGLGERAGNAALEEIVMAIRTRKTFFNMTTNIKTEEIYKTSRMVTNLTGMLVQRNKAIVGKNAFAHEAGIHQDGLLKEKTTYEIMTPESIGLKQSQLVLGKHSGRHAFANKLEEMGYKLGPKEVDEAFKLFKDLADKKKEIFDEDIQALVEDEISTLPEKFTIEYLHISSGSRTIPTATVCLKRDNEIIQDASCGDGPVDAACKAIDRITGVNGILLSYTINAVTKGKDAVGEVVVKIKQNDKILTGRSASTDVVMASAKAYLNAINKTFR
ncbi:MAG: 2-isopropylmalate synthase [bacterium]